MPGLNVDGKGTGTLVAALVDVASSGVVDAQHGDDTVGIAVGSRDVRALSLEGLQAMQSVSEMCNREEVKPPKMRTRIL